MEGSAAEDLAAPDSWEMVDLDESMRRLLVSPPKRASSPPEQDLSPPAPFPSSSSTGSLAAAASGRISDDLLDQVDQFLREALEKSRERLASSFGNRGAIFLMVLVLEFCFTKHPNVDFLWFALQIFLSIYHRMTAKLLLRLQLSRGPVNSPEVSAIQAAIHLRTVIKEVSKKEKKSITGHVHGYLVVVVMWENQKLNQN